MNCIGVTLDGASKKIDIKYEGNSLRISVPPGVKFCTMHDIDETEKSRWQIFVEGYVRTILLNDFQYFNTSTKKKK